LVLTLVSFGDPSAGTSLVGHATGLLVGVAAAVVAVLRGIRTGSNAPAGRFENAR
jgi:hypothetical protein